LLCLILVNFHFLSEPPSPLCFWGFGSGAGMTRASETVQR
jgi:hypothetical protein